MVEIMADVWKSYEKHFCKICDCWLSGHKRNILNHERSERHQNNLNHGMIRMKKRERDEENHSRDVERELKRITTAANAAVYGTGRTQTARTYERNPLEDNVMRPELMSDFSTMNPEALGSQTEFTMNDFGYGNLKGDVLVPGKPAVDENPYAPSFRFNAPAYQQPKSYELELKAIASQTTNNAKGGETEAEISTGELASLVENEIKNTVTEPYEFEGPKLSFELPADYRPPPSSFYESKVVQVIEDEEVTKAKLNTEVDPLTLETMGGNWMGGDVQEYYKRKTNRDGLEWSDKSSSKVPAAVRINADERLELLRKTNPEEALKYEIEVETLGDRKKLYREQNMLSEGKVQLLGDAGHLNRSDLNVVKKKVNLTTTAKGFKKRAAAPKPLQIGGD